MVVLGNSFSEFSKKPVVEPADRYPPLGKVFRFCYRGKVAMKVPRAVAFSSRPAIPFIESLPVGSDDLCSAAQREIVIAGRIPVPGPD
jgi:hypothetical protein